MSEEQGWLLETEVCSICLHDVDVNDIEDHYRAHRVRGDEPTGRAR